ncbi:hypothetical protein [Leifsonia sp. AG29]|uniref:hypothetical protein n=1 Tax=Leifsonia sp. AG29 TaxID=2598860 RepID=UPI00131D3143|nr:hypothetical protein [Leifsonia sp. AG29]
MLDAFGPALTAIAFLAIASLPVGAVLLVAPRSYVPMRRHVKVLPSGIAASRFGVHLLAVVRSFESGVAVLLTTLAGVAFPPERGNPFSVLVGVAVVAVTVGTVVLGVNIFSLPTPVTVGGMAALTAVAAAYSIYGIARIEKKSEARS